MQFRIGCAGWTILKPYVSAFPASGSHLERYAQRFSSVEINSSFYRPHRRTTYERWAAVVPARFAFAVKTPKEITHRLRLAKAESALDAFLTFGNTAVGAANANALALQEHLAGRKDPS